VQIIQNTVQILCFWTLSIIPFLSKAPSCLYFKQDGVLDKNGMINNVQKHNIRTNVPSSQTFRSDSEYCIIAWEYCQNIHGKKRSAQCGVKMAARGEIYKESDSVHSESKEEIAQPPTDIGSHVVAERS
jgi:hypothetical protein